MRFVNEVHNVVSKHGVRDYDLNIEPHQQGIKVTHFLGRDTPGKVMRELATRLESLAEEASAKLDKSEKIRKVATPVFKFGLFEIGKKPEEGEEDLREKKQGFVMSHMVQGRLSQREIGILSDRKQLDGPTRLRNFVNYLERHQKPEKNE